MEIPKEVKVFETYEQAGEQVKQYFAANQGIITELVTRAEQYKKDHPGIMEKTTISGGMVIETGPIYPAGIGNGLEMMCAVDLVAFAFGNQREFTFNIGHSAGLDANEERYQSLQDMANAVKNWISQEAGFYGNPKITPFVYTVNVHPPVPLPTEEEKELIKQFQEFQREAFNLQEAFNESCEESSLTEAEREEFTKAFFTE